jgi:OOP family OmpA-OmpF porin
MKKLFYIFILTLIFVSSQNILAQLPQNSWNLGIGAKYPRFFSINTKVLNMNFGGYVNLQRNFSEHLGLRFTAAFNHLESEYVDVNNFVQTEKTNAITGDLDFLFYLVPCEPISPYIFGGVGANYRMLTNYLTKTLDANGIVIQFGAGAGLEFSVSDAWKFVAEFSYRITGNSDLDGALGAGEVSGKDSYIALSLGMQYMFDQGAPSRLCQLYSGITQEYKDMTDYDKIEGMIVKHIPKEITKEVVVEKPTGLAAEKWVLVGVNFDFNSSKLTGESYPILYDAAKTLLKNPSMKVEIQGYTDNIGSEQYNKNLSQKRANIVKAYFISKGISANRLTAVGYGESNPVADNTTADGRALNRRIEFKVQ